MSHSALGASSLKHDANNMAHSRHNAAGFGMKCLIKVSYGWIGKITPNSLNHKTLQTKKDLRRCKMPELRAVLYGIGAFAGTFVQERTFRCLVVVH